MYSWYRVELEERGMECEGEPWKCFAHLWSLLSSLLLCYHYHHHRHRVVTARRAKHRVQTVIRNSKAQKKRSQDKNHNEYHTQTHTRTHMHSLSLALSLSPIGDNRSLVQSLFFDIVSLCFAFDLVKKKKKKIIAHTAYTQLSVRPPVKMTIYQSSLLKHALWLDIYIGLHCRVSALSEIWLNYLHKSHAKVTPQFHNTFTARERKRRRDREGARAICSFQSGGKLSSRWAMHGTMHALSRSHTHSLIASSDGVWHAAFVWFRRASRDVLKARHSGA